jgi:hypothetical protein
MNWKINIQKQKELDYTPEIPSWFQPIPKKIHKFAPLLAEFGKYYSKSEFQNLNILELGPGIKIQLAQFLLTKFSSLKLNCVGIPRYYRSLSYYKRKDINDYLLSLPDHSLDAVYSRFVLEEFSYHPLPLVFSSIFWRLFLSNNNLKIKEKLPGSYEYCLRTYRILGNKLKPGGRIISMLVNRNRGINLAKDKITKLFKIETCFAIGPRKGIITLQRK